LYATQAEVTIANGEQKIHPIGINRLYYDYHSKGASMSRLLKSLTLVFAILFVLACNAVTQPLNQAQDLAETAQSLATALPIETLQSFATQIPVETLQALPSAAPTIEAMASALPDFSSYFNPEGTPVSVWNDIPIMPQATAGEEFPDTQAYSFKVDATITEVSDFYNAELQTLGWSSLFNMPAEGNATAQIFQNGEQVLTVTATEVNGSVVVILTLA
jgi:hypothetical protein